MTCFQSRRVLTRRKQELERRLKEREHDTGEGFDRAELAALRCALNCIDLAISYGAVCVGPDGPNYKGQTRFKDIPKNKEKS